MAAGVVVVTAVWPGRTITTSLGCTRVRTRTLEPGAHAIPSVARQMRTGPFAVFTTMPPPSTAATAPTSSVSSAGPRGTTVDGPSTTTTGRSFGGASVP